MMINYNCMQDVKHTVIIDQIGRTILGIETSNTSAELTLDNPIIVHFQPSQTGQLELQLYPLFFFELLEKGSREKNSWTYNKSAITVSNIELNADILSRYAAINTPPEPKVEVQNNPKVISINDL
jgi:hypothetical protein